MWRYVASDTRLKTTCKLTPSSRLADSLNSDSCLACVGFHFVIKHDYLCEKHVIKTKESNKQTTKIMIPTTKKTHFVITQINKYINEFVLIKIKPKKPTKNNNNNNQQQITYSPPTPNPNSVFLADPGEN